VELPDAIRHVALFPESDLRGPPPGHPARRVEVEGVLVFLASTHPLGIVFPEELDEAEIEHVVGAVRELLAADGRSKAIWTVSEAAKPADLAERLLALGMQPNDEPGVEERHAEMVCFQAPPPGPPGINAREAETFEEFSAGMLVVTDAFEMDEAVRKTIEERAEQLWTFRDEPGSNALFVGLEGDEVIAFAGARYGRSTVYLGGSGTRSDRRGRGAYTALVRALGRGRRAWHTGSHRRSRRDVPPDPRAARVLDRRLDRQSRRHVRRLGVRLLALALRLLDDLLRDVGRHFLVAEEVHRVVAAAAGHRGQRLRVREDLGHRHLGPDRRHACSRLHTLQPAAA
jgi:hypothetical protein